MSNYNYVLGCYAAGMRNARRYSSWQEVDNETNNLVACLTYVVLFVNDQVYNHITELGGDIRRTKLFRQEARRCTVGLERDIARYNALVFRTAGVNAETYADITLSMEADIKPAIDIYRWSVSQCLLDHGVDGEPNRIASLASTINMLAQVGDLTVSDFGGRICRKLFLAHNPLDYLRLPRVRYLSGRLSDLLAPGTIDLNKDRRVADAFAALSARMLDPGVFERAIGAADGTDQKAGK